MHRRKARQRQEQGLALKLELAGSATEQAPPLKPELAGGATEQKPTHSKYHDYSTAKTVAASYSPSSSAAPSYNSSSETGAPQRKVDMSGFGGKYGLDSGKLKEKDMV